MYSDLMVTTLRVNFAGHLCTINISGSFNHGIGKWYFTAISLMALLLVHILLVPSFFWVKSVGTAQGLLDSWMCIPSAIIPPLLSGVLHAFLESSGKICMPLSCYCCRVFSGGCLVQMSVFWHPVISIICGACYGWCLSTPPSPPFPLLALVAVYFSDVRCVFRHAPFQAQKNHLFEDLRGSNFSSKQNIVVQIDLGLAHHFNLRRVLEILYYLWQWIGLWNLFWLCDCFIVLVKNTIDIRFY